MTEETGQSFQTIFKLTTIWIKMIMVKITSVKMNLLIRKRSQNFQRPDQIL